MWWNPSHLITKKSFHSDGLYLTIIQHNGIQKRYPIYYKVIIIIIIIIIMYIIIVIIIIPTRAFHETISPINVITQRSFGT